MTKNQQYVAHALITFLVTLLTGFVTALFQFATSHPLDFKSILAFAGIAFAASFTHAMLTLSITPAQALQAVWDTMNQLTASHANLAAIIGQFIATMTNQAQQTPVVQVNTAPVSGQPAQVVTETAPNALQSTPQPVDPQSAVVMPTVTLQTAQSQPGGVSEQFTAPVLPVVK